MNQWPNPKELAFFRETMVAYMAAIEGLAKNLLPIYATALNLAPNWFDEAFSEPQYVLRSRSVWDSQYPQSGLLTEPGPVIAESQILGLRQTNIRQSGSTLSSLLLN